MEPEMKSINENLKKLARDVELIKSILLRKNPEGELSDWAKKELEVARAESEDNYISLEDLRKEIENEL